MCFLLIDWLGSVSGTNLCINEGIKLGFYDRKVVSKTLQYLVGVPIVTYVGSELVYLKVFTDGSVDGKFDGLLDQWMDSSLE